jgi:hypothetical protein
VAAERLSLVLPSARASELTDGAVERLDQAAIRGSVLWLRSSDPSLKRIAIEFFSRSNDSETIDLVARTIEAWPPGTGARVSGLLTGARALRGLTTWPDALLEAREAVESRRRQVAVAAEAERVRRAEAEQDAAATRQVDIINQVRRRHDEPPLSVDEVQSVRDAVRRRSSDPNVYRNICWSCWTPVDSASNARCPDCGWLACFCGSCRKPTYVDRNGVMAGMCPREAPRHPTVAGLDL